MKWRSLNTDWCCHRQINCFSLIIHAAMLCKGRWDDEQIRPLKGSHTCWPVNHVALSCHGPSSHLSHCGLGKGRAHLTFCLLKWKIRQPLCVFLVGKQLVSLQIITSLYCCVRVAHAGESELSMLADADWNVLWMQRGHHTSLTGLTV